MASYSIVICTYNGQNTISQAMDAILSLHLYDTHVKEVLVVDNACQMQEDGQLRPVEIG